MFYFKILLAAEIETDVTTGEQAENSGDESDIIGDQDDTRGGSPRRADQAMGGMGSDDVGLDGVAFARGEADLVEQMSRVTRVMDHATGRVDDPFEGYDPQTPRDDDDLAEMNS